MHCCIFLILLVALATFSRGVSEVVSGPDVSEMEVSVRGVGTEGVVAMDSPRQIVTESDSRVDRKDEVHASHGLDHSRLLGSEEDDPGSESLGKFEFLLEELDRATAEVTSVKDELNKTKTELDEQRAENKRLFEQLLTLTNQLTELNAEIASVNRTLSTFEGDRQEHAASLAKLKDAHEREVQDLQNKIAAAERNTTLYENRAQFAKNEKNIARLSHENCNLELEAARHTHSDEIMALRAEIKGLKSVKPATCIPVVHDGPALPLSQRALENSPVPASGSCDTNQCFHILLSKYVFFWAEEHQSRDQTTAEPMQRQPTEQPAATSNPSTNSNLSGGAGLVEQALHTSQVWLGWVGTAYLTYVHPLIWRLLAWELQLVRQFSTLLWAVAESAWTNALAPFWQNTLWPALQGLYDTQLRPFWMANVYPWYRLNLEVSVNQAVAAVAAQWETHYEPWYDRHVLDYVDVVIGRVHYVAYFTVMFFTDGDLLANAEALAGQLLHFVPGVVDQLSSLPALQAQLGAQCKTVVTVVVCVVLALFLYGMRRFILGVLALLLMVILSPLLVVVYGLAVVARLVLPKKKTAKKSTSKGSGAAPVPARSAGAAVSKAMRGGEQHRPAAGVGAASIPPPPTYGRAGPPPGPGSSSSGVESGFRIPTGAPGNEPPAAVWSGYEP